MSYDIGHRNYRGFEIVDTNDPPEFDAAWAALGFSLTDVIKADRAVFLYNSDTTTPYRTRRELESVSNHYVIEMLVRSSCLEPAPDSTPEGSEAFYRLNLDAIRSLGFKKTDPLQEFMQI